MTNILRLKRISLLIFFSIIGILSLSAQTDFILTFNTTNPGNTNNNSFRLPGSGGLYDVDINNDGSYELLDQTGVIDIDVTAFGYSAGSIQVSIRNAISGGGNFQAIIFGNINDPRKLTSIDQWGSSIAFTSMFRAFQGCSNMTMAATDLANVSAVTDFSQTFQSCSLFDGDVSGWDVSSGTTFSQMFRDAVAFNQNIGSWIVSSGTSFSSMFFNADVFNQDIGGWNVGNGTNFNSMFGRAEVFDQNLNGWDVSSGQDFRAMFNDARAFNQDLNSWNTSSATQMSSMFFGAYLFDGNIASWDVSGITDFTRMFRSARVFNQDIGGWIVTGANNFSEMFNDARLFDQDISSWIVTNGTNFASMFNTASVFNQDISSWLVNNATNFSNMFSNATLFNQDISSWNVGNGTNFGGMFNRARAFNQDISGWNVSSGTNFGSMFNGTNVFNQNISGWTVTAGTNFSSMFQDALVFNQNLNSWNMSNATNITSMFFNARVFNSDISSWDVSGCTSMNRVFRQASAFNQNISSWNVSNVTDFREMFMFASNFDQNIGIWNVSSGTRFDNMFERASIFNQDIGSWIVSSGTNFKSMFSSATLFNQDISSWNVSSGTNFSNMFNRATIFNADISGWNVGNGTLFNGMFNNAQAFNQDVNIWNVTNGTQFQNMFEGTLAFNQDLDNWNMSNATNISSMFYGAQIFNGDITNWDVSGCTDFLRLFRSANAFNRDLSGWDVSNVTSFQETFNAAREFDQNLGVWDVGAMTNGNNMFSNAGMSLANWDSTLIGWHAQNFSNSNVTVGATNLRYCAAVLQRADMENDNIFDFSGDIKECSPGGVTNGTFLWYRANAESFRIGATLSLAEDGDAIDNWTDNAGDQIPATPVSTSPIYTENFVNFNPGVVFTADPLDIKIPTLLNGQADRHIVAVYQGADQDGNFFFAGNSTNPNDTAASIEIGLRTGNNATEEFGSNSLTGTVTANTPSILSINYAYTDPTIGSNNDEAFREILLNGTLIGSETLLESSGELPINLDNDTARIGGSFNSGTNEFTGTLAELIVYPVSQSGNNRRKIESYLAIKYGITLNGADYLTSNQKNIWDFSANTAYHNDIAGIFRDDLTAQDQKIGKSINPDVIVTISTPDVTADFTSINANASRALIREDRSGMLWGNNDGLIEFTASTDLTTAIAPITAMVRQWKVQRYLYTDSVNIQFTNDVILDGERYYLISDVDGDFSTSAIELSSAVAVGSTVTFLAAALGGASGDFFTLGVVDSDSDGVTDGVDLDTDNDGLPTSVESNGNDPFGDEDGDGEPNVTDVSDDGSGDGSITDYTDTNGDGVADVYDADLDGVPNYLDLDSDNDGIPDLEEADGDNILTDADHNGRIDTPIDVDGDGYHDPIDNEDGDQVVQPSEVLSGTPLTNPNTDGNPVTDYVDIDSDNDGIPDLIEAGGIDNDNNGRVDGAFTDSDGDGMSNTFDPDPGQGGTPLPDEDKDLDNIKNRLDLDSDGDGLADIIEANGTDTDSDGLVDTSTDDDGDGWANTFDSDNGGTALTVPDTDGDGLGNYIDIDSDSDGIIDIIEWQITASFDATSSTDVNNNGWDDEFDGIIEAISNNESSGAPDYLDTDSDGDGEPDWQEGFDDDEDGDVLDNFIARANAFETAAGNPNQYVSSDDAIVPAGNGIPDFLEDSDADGIPNFLDPDLLGVYYFDTDNDGLIDLFDADNNGSESNNPGALSNGDADAEPDFRDIDNDVTLPIQLVFFTATKVGEIVHLDWKTQTEINNEYFTIERSANGIDFEVIVREKGAGNSNQPKKYRQFDLAPLLGWNYYRLRQTDYDGSSDLFDPQAVFFDEVKSTAIKIYPIPSNGEDLTIELTNLTRGNYTLQVLSSRAKLIEEQTIFIENTEFAKRISLKNTQRLAKGTYYLKLITSSHAEVKIFFIN